MRDVNAWIVHTWHEYTALLLVGAGGLGLLSLVGVLVYAKVTHRKIRPAVIWLASNLALLLNAEGMWRIAVNTLHLPKSFAVLVFAVFEVSLMVAMSLASEQYQRTTERDEQTGKITKPGHPGKMLYVAWMIAILSGVVVASNAATTTETILRLALPLIVVTMWWATMTSEGQTRRRGRFAYTPTRLMERYGLLTPDDDPDYERMARDRRIRSMVTYGHRLEAGVAGAKWHEWRLTRLARSADEAMATAVAEQIDRTIGIVNRVVPNRRPGRMSIAGPSTPAAPATVPAATASVVPQQDLGQDIVRVDINEDALQGMTADGPGAVEDVDAQEPAWTGADEPVAPQRVSRVLASEPGRTRVDSPSGNSPLLTQIRREMDLIGAGARRTDTGPTASAATAPARQPQSQPSAPAGTVSLARQIYAILDDEVTANDPRQTKELVALVAQRLGRTELTPTENDSIGRTIRQWRRDVREGRRTGAPVRLRMVPRQSGGEDATE